MATKSPTENEWEGIDIKKGDGNLIVGAGSKHPITDELYTFEPGRDPIATPPATLAGPWREAIENKPKARRSARATVHKLKAGPRKASATGDAQDNGYCEGARNSILASLAGSMRRRGIGEDAIYAALCAENETRPPGPPLEESEVRAIAASIAKYEPENRVVAPVEVAGLEVPQRNDLGMSRRFAEQHRDSAIWTPAFGWGLYDGARYKPDDTDQIVGLAEETTSALIIEAANESNDETRTSILKFAQTASRRERIRAMIDLARHRLAVPAAALDANPLELNCLNGVVDLTNGKLRAHRASDMLTKCAAVAYDPSAEAPLYKKTVADVFGGNARLIEYFHRACGYGITGVTREHAIFILYGGGRNGKFTVLNPLFEVAGDYHHLARSALLMSKRMGGDTRGDIAELKGTRFVMINETPENGQLDEEAVKTINSEDWLKGRFLYHDPFSFKPSHKVFLSTNYKPVIKGRDAGIWGRLKLIEFQFRYVDDPKLENEKQIDRTLTDRLLAEAPGILNWLVQGARTWYRDGLKEPSEVTRAVEGYKSETDTLKDFLDEMCEREPDARAGIKELYVTYTLWAKDNGQRYPWSAKYFGTRLQEAGFVKDPGDRQRLGLRLSVVAQTRLKEATAHMGR